MVKKDNKKQYKMLTDEDMKVIQSDPAGLADYIVYNKVKSTRKTALVMGVIAVAVSFGLGVFAGVCLARTSIPNSVVQVQVGGESSDAVVNADEGK